VQTNMNAKIGDRYLFAGTDVSNQPYTGASTATSNMQARVSDWLDGTTSTDDFLAGIKGMTDGQLGYSSTLSSAKNVYARADENFEVDYTVLANDDGFKTIVAGLNAIANLQQPVEGTDAPTKEQFHDTLDNLYKFVQAGVESLRNSSAKIASAAQSLDTVGNNHLNDKQNLSQILEKTEASDTTDAVVHFQALQSQLEASYRVTSILSQLSLARFLSTT